MYDAAKTKLKYGRLLGKKENDAVKRRSKCFHNGIILIVNWFKFCFANVK
jgi:hypothetical protein